MYGLAVNLTMSVSGHPSIINEMTTLFERNEDRVTGFLK